MVKTIKISPQKVHFKIKYPNMECEMNLNLGRFEGQYQKAQKDLDTEVMQGMIPYMPMDTGTFINVTKAMSEAIAGSGKVIAAAPPHGRFLYMGKVMVDESTGSPWARKSARKVLVSQYAGKTNAKEDIDYSKSAHKKATEKWFEEAKKNHGKRWVNLAKKTAGGG